MGNELRVMGWAARPACRLASRSVSRSNPAFAGRPVGANSEKKLFIVGAPSAGSKILNDELYYYQLINACI